MHYPISGYFDFLIGRYLAAPSKEWPQIFLPNGFGRFLPQTKDTSDDAGMQVLQLLSYHYFQVLFCLVFVDMALKARLPREQSASLEASAHKGLFSLISTCFQLKGKTARIIGHRLVLGATKYAEHLYVSAPRWNKEHRVGPFSAIRLPELSLLAKRDSTLLKHYGAKNVERVFEHQLALLMQSLGLCVIATRAGLNTVDLVCISLDPNAKITFLLEAKTTKSRYSLPKKDSRAIKEYVQDVRKGLSTLPPLSFVLVVGHTPAQTLRNKLLRLEAEASIPMRFIRAQQLADLRERLPGPIPIATFTKELILGERIVTDALIERVTRNYHAEQKAYRKFAEAMFTVRGVLSTTLDWAAHEPDEDGCNNNKQ